MYLRLLLTVATLAASPYATACSCKGTLKQAVADASQIFVGQIIATQLLSLSPGAPAIGVQADIDIAQNIKGSDKNNLTVSTGAGGGDCGVPLHIGNSYVFFVSADRRTSICAGTRRYVSGNKESDEFLNQVKSYVLPTP